MKAILAIDQGTTSTRAIAFSIDGKKLFSSQLEFKQYFPKNGWVEHDPCEIWDNVKFLISKLLKKNKLKSSQILSIGIANQRETSILWNKKNGKPVYNAIVWQDRRTLDYCKYLKKKKKGDIIQKITGLVIDPYFSSTKIKWILENSHEAKKNLKNNNLLFGTVDTWLLWNLTEKKSHITDITNASRTMLYDLEKEEWSNKLLKIFNIPKKILPKVTENSYNFGTTSLFGEKIKIGGMAGDQQAAAIGQCCFKKGQSKSTYGTGCFILMNIGKTYKISKNKLLTSIAYKINNEKMYCLEGSIFVAGSAIQWMRDQLSFFKNSKEANLLYSKAKEDENIIMVPALTGLGAPYWQPNVRGSILGLTRNTSISQIVRATLDSIAFQTQDLIESMQKDSTIKIKEMRVDGGMIENHNFIQSIANIIQTKIIKPKNIEASSLGVAYLAAVNEGIISDINSINNLVKSKKIFLPKINKSQVKKKMEKWKKAVNFLIDYHS